MGIYLSDAEIKTMTGESHALITMYAMAIRPRMNWETGMVGDSSRISYRALMEWCYIEPCAQGGAKPVQLSIQQARRLVGRMEKIGLLNKSTIAAGGREYIELFCPKASLKGQIPGKTTPAPALTGKQQIAPPFLSPPKPSQKHGGCSKPFVVSACRFDRPRRQRVSRAFAKTEILGTSHQCVQIATDRGSDRLKPSNGKGFKAGSDRGVDIHQRGFKGKPLLPPTPFSKHDADRGSSGDLGNPQPSQLPATSWNMESEEMKMNPADQPSRPPLIWPICIHETQKLGLLQHLAASLQPQALLDELAGAYQARIIRSSPVGYLKGLILREQAGTFIPERGIAVLETRRANARHEAQAKRSDASARERPMENFKPVPEHTAIGKILAKHGVRLPLQDGKDESQ